MLIKKWESGEGSGDGEKDKGGQSWTGATLPYQNSIGIRAGQRVRMLVLKGRKGHRGNISKGG